MSGYILTILGIVLAGILIDIIVPTGKINKYIKSIFAIFVVAVILMPVVKFIAKSDEITINYTDYEIEQNLMDYIFSSRVTAYENEIIEVYDLLQILINDKLTIHQYNNNHTPFSAYSITFTYPHKRISFSS